MSEHEYVGSIAVKGGPVKPPPAEEAKGPSNTRFLGLETEEILEIAARRDAMRAKSESETEEALSNLEGRWAFRLYVQLQRFVDWQQAKIDGYFRRRLLRNKWD